MRLSALVFARRIKMSIAPPLCVRGMTEWQPELFSTSVLIPCLRVGQEQVGAVRKPLESVSLKMVGLRPVQTCPDFPAKRLVLLSPSLITMFKDIVKEPMTSECLKSLDISVKDFTVRSFDLTVQNWTPHDLIKAILPEGEEGVSGFSIIGHIIHLNLKEHLEPFKDVIGEALLLTKQIRTVVNKSSTIDNTYRNFAMELLAGEEDFQVCVKENGCSFEFDFSKVYWNPRLSCEHSRITSRLSSNSILFDACAGVGPFAVPAALTGALVIANDLNPDSFKWLKVNCDKVKKKGHKVECHNMDARDFIKDRVKDELIKLWKSDLETEKKDKTVNVRDIHITMNLPALAITFLGVFRGLLKDFPDLKEVPSSLLPKVHVYGFSKAENKAADIQERCEKYLGDKLDSVHLEEVSFVRNVAPNKDMLRASFLVPKTVMFDMDPVAPGDIVEDIEEEEELVLKSSKRDLSPDNLKTDSKKKITNEPVWYGERF